MSSFDEAWARRRPIAIDNTTGSSTIDAEFTIPEDWDDFWDHVQSDGDDIRLVDADGVTVLDYQIAAAPTFDVSARDGKLEINDYAAPTSDGTVLVWLVWDNDSATSAAGSFSTNTPKTCSVELGCPSPPLVVGDREREGDTAPRRRMSKAPAEELHVWWDLEGLLSERCELNNGTSRYEEIDYVQFQVLNAAAADQSAMYDETETRFGRQGQSEALVRTTVKAGADGDDYTLSLTVGTTTGRVLNPRALLQVRAVTAS